MSFRRAIERSWVKPNAITLVFWPLSLVYRLLFAIRGYLFALRVFKSYRSPVPVVVVGNLTVGGTGKTPLVIHLIEELRKLGFKPGVISRGYGGMAESYPFVVTKDSLVGHSGDEPALIVRRTGAPMVVGSDRKASVEKILELSDVDIIISDDGLQHLALQRDIEICLLDSTSPQKNRFLLPAGPYRESLSRLKTVDLTVEHGAISDNAGRFSMNLNASAPQRVNATTQNNSSFSSVEPFHAVAGIGNPARFFDTCTKLGYTFTEHAYPDHHAFRFEDIDFGDSTVLMTEKDAVKCQEFAQSRHWYLPVDATLSPEFAAALKAKLAKVK